MSNATYAMLCVSRESEATIRRFLIEECGLRGKYVRKRLRLTLYYAPLELRSLDPIEELIDVQVDVAETRFMVMGPGGENPRPELSPADPKKQRLRNASRFPSTNVPL